MLCEVGKNTLATYMPYKQKTYELRIDLDMQWDIEREGMVVLKDRFACQEVRFWPHDMMIALRHFGSGFPEQKPSRKVIQIAASDEGCMVAICDDGTIWRTDGDLDSIVPWRQINSP